MIGMDDLRHAVVILDAAADDPLGADRQQATQLVALSVEIDQHQGAAAVRDKHPRRTPPDARLVALDLGLHGDDRSLRPVARMQRSDGRRGAAIDEAHWQVPQQIDDIGAGGALDEPAELRPDAGQHRHRREQPVEKGGTHA